MEISPFKKARTEFEAAEKKLRADHGKIKTEGYFESQEALDKLIQLTPDNYRDAAEWLIAMATIARMRNDIRWFPKQLETMLEQHVESISKDIPDLNNPDQIRQDDPNNDLTRYAITEFHNKLKADYQELVSKKVESNEPQSCSAS